jgi:hypothetical protein
MHVKRKLIELNEKLSQGTIRVRLTLRQNMRQISGRVYGGEFVSLYIGISFPKLEWFS